MIYIQPQHAMVLWETLPQDGRTFLKGLYTAQPITQVTINVLTPLVARGLVGQREQDIWLTDKGRQLLEQIYVVNS